MEKPHGVPNRALAGAGKVLPQLLTGVAALASHAHKQQGSGLL